MRLVKILLVATLLAIGAGAIAVAQDKRVVRVVVHHVPPFVITGQRPSGYAIDLLEAVAVERGLTVEYQIVDNPAEGIAAIEAGDADLHPSLGINESRAEKVDFTRPFEYLVAGLFVRESQVARLQGTKDRSTLVYGATQGSIPARILNGIEGVQRVYLKDHNATLVALASNQIDGAVYGANTFRSLVRSIGVENKFVQFGEDLKRTPIAFAVKKGNAELLAQINDGLAAVTSSQEFTRIRTHWFPSPPPYWNSSRILTLGVGAFAFLVLAGALILMRVRDTERRRRLDEAVRFTNELASANLDLEQRNEEMRHLVYMVSHDLNSPLASIGGFARRLTRGLDKGDEAIVRDSTERITRNIGTMRRLLDGVLVLNRASSNTLQRERVQSTLLAQAVRDALSEALQAKSATLNVKVETPDLICDAMLITQSVQNLIENALKHGCPDPGMEVTLRFAREGGDVRITVSDQGPGVPIENREEVFRPFIRGPEARREGKEGLGIGLATVKAIVEKHGGRLWVEQDPCGGARFVIELPYADVAPDVLEREIF